MHKVTLRLLKLTGWLLFGGVISVFMFMMIASLCGWNFDVVPTKSMEPVYNAGGMVVARPARAQDIKIGDPILFKQPFAEKEALICHRVIDMEKVGHQLFFQTKGDANEYQDPEPVPSQNLIGKVILYIPQVGNIAYFSRLYETPINFLGMKISTASLCISAIMLAIATTEVKNLYKWVFTPGLKRREEIVKQRKERLLKRKKRFGIRG
jgi:signal peptidase